MAWLCNAEPDKDSACTWGSGLGRGTARTDLLGALALPEGESAPLATSCCGEEAPAAELCRAVVPKLLWRRLRLFWPPSASHSPVQPAHSQHSAALVNFEGCSAPQPA